MQTRFLHMKICVSFTPWEGPFKGDMKLMDLFGHKFRYRFPFVEGVYVVIAESKSTARSECLKERGEEKRMDGINII